MVRLQWEETGRGGWTSSDGEQQETYIVFVLLFVQDISCHSLLVRIPLFQNKYDRFAKNFFAKIDLFKNGFLAKLILPKIVLPIFILFKS